MWGGGGEGEINVNVKQEWNEVVRGFLFWGWIEEIYKQRHMKVLKTVKQELSSDWNCWKVIKVTGIAVNDSKLTCAVQGH